MHGVLLSVLVLGADTLTGTDIQFPIVYVIPTMFASWYNGENWGIVSAIVLSISRLLIHPLCGQPTLVWTVGINFSIRLIVLVGIAVLTS